MTGPAPWDPGSEDPGATLLDESADAALEERLNGELRAALARHLLDGRRAADAAHLLLAVVTVFVFWKVTPPWAALGWLATFLVTTVLRSVNRRRAVLELGSSRAIAALVRRDVWIAATLWGGWALVNVGVPPVDLALLLLIFAGQVSAATSTLQADRPAFLGFVGFLFGPTVLAILLGGVQREEGVMLILIAVFIPIMVIVHRRTNALLVEQIRSESKLRVSDEEAVRGRDFLNALLASAPLAMVVLDAKARVLRVNPAFERGMGYSGDAIRHREFAELVADPMRPAPVATFLEMVRAGERASADLPMKRGDGTSLWMRLSGTLAQGTAEGTMILVGEDVTQHVEARETQTQARIQAEEAARAKSSFLASMSHEIRTPLNGILGMVEILLDTPLTQSQRQTAEIIRASGQGLLRILNDVLDVSKIEAGQLDLEEMDFDLHSLVSDVARMFTVEAARRDNEILVDVGATVPRRVRGDPHRLRQIMANLVSNAVKFTDRGEVVLALRSAQAPDDLHGVLFSVRDTGMGIPSEKQEQIFAEFEQADSSTTRTHGGTGLGLSIARRLVELMGSEIVLTSEPGRGSDFHFTLSLRQAEAAEAEPSSSKPPPALRGRRFLVVDDSETARRIAREALELVGASVDEAQHVDAGLDRLTEAAGQGTPYDAVILDHMMPKRDGFDFARAVHALDHVVPPFMLMLTSAGPAGGAERARSEGIRGYMTKPVSRADLYQALGQLLVGGDTEGSAPALVTRESIGRATTAARILLAEDNPVNQQVAIALLHKLGHDVVAVSDGRAALEAVESQLFDLVLMDIQMPDMDGLEATREIRMLPEARTLPIIALTAHAFAEERERCRAAGMDDFLAKPFKPDDLFDVVERWTGQEGGARRPPSGPVVTTMAETPGVPVDVERFRAVMKEAGVEEVVDATLEVYVAEAPALFEKIAAAVAAADGDAVRKSAHSLKSASGNIRANRLAELLQAMEDLCGADDVEATRAAFQDLSREFRSVMRYLEEVRSG